MALQDHPKYEYSTLADILKMFPVPLGGAPKRVNTYGVVVSYNKQKNEVVLMDETQATFSTFINPLYDPHSGKAIRPKRKDPSRKPVRLPFRTGDILRIHRLLLNRDFTTRSHKVADLVVFKSFRETDFLPTHLSSNPSFSKYDLERVRKLRDLSVAQLLRADVKLIHSAFNGQNMLVTNTAFQVLAVQPEDKRHIVVCWNGLPFTKYPCHASVPLDIIIEKLRLSKRPTENYTFDFVERLYKREKLIFITVYGDVHRLTANKLQPMDFIAIYNLVIKPDKYFYQKYSFLMFESEVYGRAIRLCSPKSKIGKFFGFYYF